MRRDGRVSLPDEEEQWQRYGSCWGSFDSSFFPDTYGGKRAVAICERCPVEEVCLDYAIVTNQKHGVWGGKTRSQRLKIRYRERDAKKP